MRRELKMKKLLNLFVALLAVVTSIGVALAEETETGALAPDKFSSSFTLTSDYVFRGISQTDETPAVQGSFDYSHPMGLYAGIWGSSLASGMSKANVELDFYVGYAGEFGTGFGYDLSVIYYQYPSGELQGGVGDPDFLEGSAGLTYTLSDITLSPEFGVNLAYSPDFFGEDGTGIHYSGSVALSLPVGFGLEGLLGVQDVEGDKLTPEGFDYMYYRVGVTRELLGFGLDLSWWDTDLKDTETADSRFVFTVSRSF